MISRTEKTFTNVNIWCIFRLNLAKMLKVKIIFWLPLCKKLSFYFSFFCMTCRHKFRHLVCLSQMLQMFWQNKWSAHASKLLIYPSLSFFLAFNMGQTRPLLVYFSTFNNTIKNIETIDYKWKMHRWCALDSNPGPQKGRWPPILSFSLSLSFFLSFFLSLFLSLSPRLSTFLFCL